MTNSPMTAPLDRSSNERAAGSEAKRVLDPFLPTDVEHRRPRRFLTPSLWRRATLRLAEQSLPSARPSQETNVLTICSAKNTLDSNHQNTRTQPRGEKKHLYGFARFGSIKHRNAAIPGGTKSRQDAGDTAAAAMPAGMLAIRRRPLDCRCPHGAESREGV